MLHLTEPARPESAPFNADLPTAVLTSSFLCFSPPVMVVAPISSGSSRNSFHCTHTASVTRSSPRDCITETDAMVLERERRERRGRRLRRRRRGRRRRWKVGVSPPLCYDDGLIGVKDDVCKDCRTTPQLCRSTRSTHPPYLVKW